MRCRSRSGATTPDPSATSAWRGPSGSSAGSARRSTGSPFPPSRVPGEGLPRTDLERRYGPGIHDHTRRLVEAAGLTPTLRRSCRTPCTRSRSRSSPATAACTMPCTRGSCTPTGRRPETSATTRLLDLAAEAGSTAARPPKCSPTAATGPGGRIHPGREPARHQRHPRLRTRQAPARPRRPAGTDLRAGGRAARGRRVPAGRLTRT